MSAPAPPLRFWIDVKLTAPGIAVPVSLPALLLVTVQLFVEFEPMIVLFPPPPPIVTGVAAAVL